MKMTTKYLYNHLQAIYIAENPDNFIYKYEAIKRQLFFKKNKPDMFKYLELARSFNFEFLSQSMISLNLSKINFKDENSWIYSSSERNNNNVNIIYWQNAFGWNPNYMYNNDLFTMLDKFDTVKRSLEVRNENRV